MKISILITYLFIISAVSYSSNTGSPGDTLAFSSEKDRLIILTQNPDSIKYHIKKGNYPNPFSPSMKDYAAKINTYDTTYLIVSIQDAHYAEVKTFRWEKVTPGAYEFDWWDYLNFEELPSGVYYVDVIINNGKETTKAVIVK
jgi:hypothetical protein